MKKRPLFLCLSTLICALCVPFNELSAQTTKWDYPVKPGTPEWVAFKSHREMIEACQVPEGVLSSMTTEELVEVCLNYPMFDNIWAYDSFPMGLRHVAKHSNAMQELFRRNDNVQHLLNLLKEKDLVENPFKTYGESVYRHGHVELLLSHPSVIANASAVQLKEMSVIGTKNAIIKRSQIPLYGYYVEASAYLSCASMTAMNGGVPLSPALERFMETGLLQSESELYQLLCNFTHVQNRLAQYSALLASGKPNK